ncbi:MAG TPA: ATP-binding protein [Steroidobacteraceae bacterium]|nr:ATP-binding protein [Steroidobacteraceae bacterium]
MQTDPRVNILLVDDEPANLHALQAVLEPLEQNLITAASGTQALRQVLEHDFAVILLDVQMPDMSGIEAAAMIRERERSKTTPIIFLTGVVKTAEMMFKGYSAGAVDYLMKPVISGVLRAKVEVFVELAQVRHSLHQEIAERARIAVEVSKLNMVLEQRNEDLMAANSDLEAFSHSVSHDLRMPLRHIQAYVSMIEESALAKLTADEQRRLKGVREAAQRMSQLIDDLLAFSRIGRTQLRKAPIDLNALVKEVIAQLQPEIRNRQVEWTLETLPYISGDRALLHQVLTNLLANAVKYTRTRAEAHIQVFAVEQDDEIIVGIEDNGVGYDPAYSDKLFGVFQRLHSATEFEGTGVGLANVRRIVQRHGGRTWAESVPNEGATFYFTLPTPSKAESRMAAPDAETVAVPLRSAENRPSGAQTRSDDPT